MSIAQLEEDKSQYAEQLEIVLLSLKDDPTNAELLGLKEELDSAISMIDESIAELQPTKKPAAPKPAAKTRAPSPPPAPAPTEKWSRENHAAFKRAGAGGISPTRASPTGTSQLTAAEDQDGGPIVSYQVNDSVLAKWVSGDKGFYPARITSVTGSSTAPIYTVKFKSYDTVETLRARDIRPIASPVAASQKRKADGTPVTAGGGSAPHSSSSTPTSAGPDGGYSPATAYSAGPSTLGGAAQTPPPPPPPPSGSTSSNNGVVLSAAPSVYPIPQGGGEGGADGKPAKKFKKIKATKELEAGKSKWQDFNQKSKFGKSHKKDSMFRTPDGIHGRVGFTGSGQAMRKDPSRSRHVYQPNEDLD